MTLRFQASERFLNASAIAVDGRPRRTKKPVLIFKLPVKRYAVTKSVISGAAMRRQSSYFGFMDKGFIVPRLPASSASPSAFPHRAVFPVLPYPFPVFQFERQQDGVRNGNIKYFPKVLDGPYPVLRMHQRQSLLTVGL